MENPTKSAKNAWDMFKTYQVIMNKLLLYSDEFPLLNEGTGTDDLYNPIQPQHMVTQTHKLSTGGNTEPLQGIGWACTIYPTK